MEAIILAGGKAERLGDAAGGRPKALVPVGGKALATYQVRQLASAGVDRVVVSCASGKGPLFEHELQDVGPEVVVVEEAEPLGRGGGLRLAARELREPGPCFALNGDELLDVDFLALRERHEGSDAAGTIVVAPLRSPFGVVEVTGEDRVTGFKEAPILDGWVSAGVYVLGAEARDRLPERGDHETSLFPELAAEGRLRAFRHNGVWMTVNTPKDLRHADEFLAAHPEWPLRPRRLTPG